MTDNTKGKKKTAKRGGTREVIFEVYRILAPLSLDNFEAFDGFNSSPPFTTTEKKLSEICMQKFGPGQYVAFQLSESGEGDPLSYWVVKVRDRETHNAMRVYPNEELINVIREERKPSGLIDFFYRRNLAAIASLCLQQLEEPKAKKSRETPAVTRARELIKLHRSKAVVIRRLIAEAQTLWSEEKFVSDPKAVDRAARTAYLSGQRANRREEEEREAKKVGKKTRRT